MVLNTASSISLSQLNATAYFSNGKMGINTTNPTADLDVNGVINSTGLTTGNINFTGSLYQNGLPYSVNSSQWTTTAGNVSYTSGSVIATDAVFTNVTYANAILTNATINNFSFGTNVTVNNLLATNLNLGVSSMYSGSFIASNNVISATDVTGFSFANANIRSFNASVSISIVLSAGTSLYSMVNLNGTQNASGWSLFSETMGDTTGIAFTITNAGQIQYTSTNQSNWSSTIFRFSAQQFSATGTYSSLSANTQGSYIIDSIQLNSTEDAVSGVSNGPLYLLGGATITKTLNANGGISTGTINASTGITTGVLIATTGITTGGLLATGLVSAANLAATTATIPNIINTNVSTGVLIASTGITTGGLLATGLVSAANLAATNVSTGGLNATGISVLANVTATNFSTGTLVASTGITTGTINLTSTKIALGANSGLTAQGNNSVAIGSAAGQISQGTTSVALGTNAGYISQGQQAVAIGNQAGQTSQTTLAVAIGNSAAQNYQGYGAVAMGYQAGTNSQGSYAIAMGFNAGQTSQHQKSIILNANDVALNSAATGAFYVSSVRNVAQTNILAYDTTAKEVTYFSLSNITTSNLVATNVSTGVLIASTGITSATAEITNVSSTTISTGTLLANTITGANLSLSGNLIVGGTLTTVNITSTNMLNTNISAGTINATELTSLQNVTATNISTGTINASTGITSGNINSTGLTTGNINFTGSLFQNGTPYLGSQWTTTSGNVSYTSGSVVATNIVNTNISTGNINSAGLTTGNINFTGSLFQNGVPYVGSQWTTTSGNVSYTSGSVVATNISTGVLNAASLTAGNINFTGSLYQNGAPYSSVPVANIVSRYQTTGTQIATTGNTIVTFDTANNNYSVGTPGITYSAGAFINTNSYSVTLYISYSVVFPYNNTGTRAAWVQDSTGTITGFTEAQAVSSNNGYTSLAGSAMILLASNASFAIYAQSPGGTALTTISGLGGTSMQLSCLTGGFAATQTNILARYLNSVQSVPTSTNTTVLYDTSDIDNSIGSLPLSYSAGTFTNTGSSAIQISITYTVSYVSASPASASYESWISCNSLNYGYTAFTGSWPASLNGKAQITVPAGGTFTIVTWQNSGVSQNLNNGNKWCSIQISALTAGASGGTINATTTSNTVGRLFTTTSGNIGINTTSPAYTLDVNGSLNATTATIPNIIHTNISSGTVLATSNLIAVGNSNTIGSLYTTGGNIGVGTVTPSYKVDVSGSGRFTGSLYAAGNISVNSLSAPSYNLDVSGTGRFTSTLYAAGNVGINTNSPSYWLDVNAGSNSLPIRIYGSHVDGPVIRFENNNAGGQTYHVGSTASGSGAGRGFSVYDLTNGTTRLLIGNTGNVGIGTTNPITVLSIKTGAHFFANGSGDQIKIHANGVDANNGYFYYNAGNSYGTASDRRLKYNITPINSEDAITFISNITPSDFCLNGQTERQSGFIAQNVLAAAQNDAQKSAVAKWETYDETDPESPFMGVSERPILSNLIVMVKHQQTYIQALESRLAALEQKINI